MTTLTPEDRDALRALAENATPGPWLPHARYVWTSELGGIIQNWSDDANAAADMEFIAAARTAVPALLDALDQAEAERHTEYMRRIYAERGSTVHQVIAQVVRAERAEAERDQARAQVDRVRELLDQYGPDHSPECGWEDCTRCAVNEVHRALDGEQ